METANKALNPKVKKIITKSYGDSYLYNKNLKSYDAKLIDFIMKADKIDKTDTAFEDIRYDVKKRQITSYLAKVMDSNAIILLYQAMPLPKAFKVFAANDIKGDGKVKIFIDTSDIFNKVNGKWTCNNIDIFIAYLVSAMNQRIYYADPKRLLMKDGIISAGAYAFSSLFTYIIDYLYKISSVSSVRDKCLYLSSMYYLVNILGKDINDSSQRLCRSIAGISEKEEEIINIQIDKESCYLNINYFIQEIGKALPGLTKLTLDAFLEKWLYIYGVGTQFALELYPAFASMMTNVYVGCYLNNQKTIEKIAGRKVVEISTTILKVGAESI